MNWPRRGEHDDEGLGRHPSRHIWTMCVDCRCSLVLDPEAFEVSDDEICRQIVDGELLPRCVICAPQSLVREAQQFLGDVW
jgi:hypothetical protein